MIEKIGLKCLHRLNPETAHNASLLALKMGLVPKGKPKKSPRLHTSIGGIALKNPIGLAAGYDKNAVALSPLSKMGFGFLEVGAATPLPQDGNPKPRLFRLTQDRAVINRFGFNNEGIAKIAQRLAQVQTDIPRGLNLGANKNAADRIDDYCHVLKSAAPYVDFVTLNISSPNTEKLRDLQGKAALEELLTRVCDTNNGLDAPKPIFLKIAPDLSEGEIQDIAELALKAKLSAIIATNTTLDRTGLTSADAAQAGGLSGQPLFERSTRVLAQLYNATEGKIDLIGVGGISNAQDAFDKIKAGANAVQLYSAMVYGGIGMIAQMTHELDHLLASQGYDNMQSAVGVDAQKWL